MVCHGYQNIAQFLDIFVTVHLGGYVHMIDQGIELKCVRRAFVFKTRAQSATASALRQVVAPYLNLLCLPIDCSQFPNY